MQPRFEFLFQHFINQALTRHAGFTGKDRGGYDHAKMGLARSVIPGMPGMFVAVIDHVQGMRLQGRFQLRFDLIFHPHTAHNKKDMPRIQLKPQSPEYADRKPRTATRVCDMPGCRAAGEHKAPKDRSLSEHYHFCLAHVAEYNKAWDYFSGMNDAEVQDHIFKSYYGDRPTWRYDVDGAREDLLYRAAWQAYHFTEEEPSKTNRDRALPDHSPETEALAIFGLEPPIDLAGIKKRYKELAKAHHPDLNKNDPKAEEQLKRINMAYTVLKLAHEKFAAMEQ